MLRKIVCSLVALALVAGVSLAAQKEVKAKTASGKFVSSKDGTLTLKVVTKKGEEPKDTAFKVADDVKVTIFAGTDKKEAVAKDAFKDVKEGTVVTVTIGEGDKVTAVQIGTAPKKDK